MNSKELIGLQVISARTGERTGTVAHAYIDPLAKKLIGFAIHAGGGFFSPQSEPLIDVDEVQALGPDALVLADSSATEGVKVQDRYNALLPLENVIGTAVLTENGTSFGKVASAEINPTTFRIVRIESSSGFLKSNTTIPIRQVTTIGPDYVIVSNTVLADTGEAATAPASQKAD